MEEIRPLMKGKEDKGRDYLHHEFIVDDLLNSCLIPYPGRLVKQPATDHKETRHTQQEQHIIKGNEIFFETEHTDMRVNYENHRESPHRINILYPFLYHTMLQRYEIYGNIFG